jgi:hypothetical protein
MSDLTPVPPQPALAELIARAHADPASDEAHFLAQLRAAILGCEARPAAYVSRTRSPRPELRIVSREG